MVFKLFGDKNEWNNCLCSNMDGPGDYPEWKSQRQILYDISYTWNLKTNTNELIYKTETDSEIENKLPKGEMEVGIN